MNNTNGTHTPMAPPWVPAALSWGREMEAFCTVAVGVEEFVTGERNDDQYSEAHDDLLNATNIARAAVEAWKSAGATPLDVATAITTINELVTTKLVPIAELRGYQDPEVFRDQAERWIVPAHEVCNRIDDVAELVKGHLNELLRGTGQAFEEGAKKAAISSVLKKAGMVLVTVILGVGLWSLSKRS